MLHSYYTPNPEEPAELEGDPKSDLEIFFRLVVDGPLAPTLTSGATGGATGGCTGAGFGGFGFGLLEHIFIFLYLFSLCEGFHLFI